MTPSMADTPETGNHSRLSQVHSQNIDTSRCDGSRTPPDVQYEIMRRHKEEVPITTIAEQVGCDPRTVKAVIQNWGNSAHRLRLEAHKAQVVDSLILGMHQAAEKGKLDSILSLSDRLGITEPVKGQNLAQVAVQINLHGGPEPQALVVGSQPRETSQETGVNTPASDNGAYVMVDAPVTVDVSET
jgi:hypothetical protein